ncbi:MAG TPA: hypothetical protein VIJ61_15320, partial [Thermoanaerobaculia bacterium]
MSSRIPGNPQDFAGSDPERTGHAGDGAARPAACVFHPEIARPAFRGAPSASRRARRTPEMAAPTPKLWRSR